MTDFSFLKNFKITDFQCRCSECADDPARPHTKIEVLRAVQDLRDRLGEPVVLTRGVSCEAHNKAVGGAGDSRHLPQHADAVDIAIADDHEAYLIVRDFVGQAENPKFLEMAVFTTCRIYAHHVHLDARPGRPMIIASPE